MQRRLDGDNATLHVVATRSRLDVTLYALDAFDDDTVLVPQHLQHAALLATVTSCNDDDEVALLDLGHVRSPPEQATRSS